MTSACPICLEDVGDESAYKDDAFILACGDAFCRACIEKWVTVDLSQGRQTVECPVLSCKRGIEIDDMRNLVPDAQTLRRVELLANPHLRECPHPNCGSLVSVHGRSEEEPDILCASCGQDFCLVHDRLHVGKPCKEFLTRSDRKQYEAYARRRHLKRCPACKRAIDKWTGCDAMRCACGHRFNWAKVPTEFPCSCVHWSSADKLPMWGHLCPGHSSIATAKITAWRTMYVIVGVGIVLPAAATTAVVVGCGVGAYKLARTGTKCAKRNIRELRAPKFG
mmetsp:Transcript_10446/g.27118  ORF Transcript_10446/g.27118 Transcript_10446/m.27118 type:complete len:279 (-) Transcript_10446:627-1463(-)|eukprot:CAMPEP_0119421480 /NCGR_PEP_ID=MMETSP1335-20130426/26005_1 /TAXON_ID=259385 /ORGANISM="Chrysoculter rhomboideus, Strain RCC1486" /LENGTH=278 /DNA_ID=CAMNT_0007446887 /DNA_START=153 /DNA_END=989 /DNA_ORIENTATION=+